MCVYHPFLPSFLLLSPQLTSWMKDASESFLVRFDLGTSLETTEDLIMEFEEFRARAKVRSPQPYQFTYLMTPPLKLINGISS